MAFASHDQNYLYDLTRGRRVKIPDKSDAVATPDGRYITVPSHYTPNHTVNFYDAATLLARLDEGKDALDVKPAFAHDGLPTSTTITTSRSASCPTRATATSARPSTG